MTKPKLKVRVDILKENIINFLKLHKPMTSNEILKKLKDNFDVCAIKIENETPVLTLIFDKKKELKMFIFTKKV